MGCSGSKGVQTPLNIEQTKESMEAQRIQQRIKTQSMDKSLQVSTIPTANDQTLIDNVSEAVVNLTQKQVKVPVSPTRSLQKSDVIHRRNEQKKSSTKKKELSMTSSNLQIARMPSQKSKTKRQKSEQESKMSISPATIRVHSGGESQLDEPLQSVRSAKHAPELNSAMVGSSKFGPIIIEAGFYKKRVLSDQRLLKQWGSSRKIHRNSCLRDGYMGKKGQQTCRAPKDIRLQTLFKIYGFQPQR